MWPFGTIILSGGICGVNDEWSLSLPSYIEGLSDVLLPLRFHASRPGFDLTVFRKKWGKPPLIMSSDSVRLYKTPGHTYSRSFGRRIDLCQICNASCNNTFPNYPPTPDCLMEICTSNWRKKEAHFGGAILVHFYKRLCRLIACRMERSKGSPDTERAARGLYVTDQNFFASGHKLHNPWFQAYLVDQLQQDIVSWTFLSFSFCSPPRISRKTI